jgi:hypothetical protein
MVPPKGVARPRDGGMTGLSTVIPSVSKGSSLAGVGITAVQAAGTNPIH